MGADRLKAEAGLKRGGRKSGDPVYAYSLAWHPEQSPERAEMLAAADASLKHLGFGAHQALLVAHTDEPHPHIHVIVNRVHPETGKTHNPGNDFLRLSTWAEAYEWEHGRIYCEERVLNNEIRRAGGRAKDEVSLSRADYERQAAEEATALKPEALVSAVARHHAHFTAGDLKREAENRTAVKPDETVREALSDPRLVKLYDSEGQHVAYTTKDTRQQETDTLDRAERMAGTMRHRVSSGAMQAAMESRTLDAEQRTAMISALGPGGMKVIEGQAGTGKSYCVDAIAEAARRDGYHVVGLAKTNPVAADMGKTGAFSDARSINSLMWRVERMPDDPTARVDAKTMLVIDEAAMVETRLLDRVTKLAEERGAKVILVGHDRQLSAVEYGGLFTDIAAKTGSAQLTQVRRQEEGWARQASSDMAEGRFDKALKAFDAHGKIDWKEDLAGSRAALVEQWSRDTAEMRGERFAFAYTNDEVIRLNAAMQEIEVERGRVDNLTTLEAHDGQLVMGEGDRIAFKGTDKCKHILNGTLGTVEKIEGTKLTVKADAGPTISFDTDGPEAFNAFRLGYAGTIYSGQGKTLDQVYVLHTRHWRDASTYVALTRARADTRMYVAREECTGRGRGNHFDRLVGQLERQAYRGSSLQYSTTPPARDAFEAATRDQEPEPGPLPIPVEPEFAYAADDAERPGRTPAPPDAHHEEELTPSGSEPEAEQRSLDAELKWAAEQLADDPPSPAPPEPSRDAVEDEEMKPRPGLIRPPRNIQTLPADQYAEAVKAIEAEDAAAARAVEPPPQNTPEMPQPLTQGDQPVAEDREKLSSAPAFNKAASPNQPEPEPTPDIEQTGSTRQPPMAGPARFQPTGPMAGQAAQVNHQVEMEADARRNVPTQQPPSPAPSGGTDKQALLDAFRAARDKHQDLSSQDRDGPDKDGPGHGHDGPDRKPKGPDLDR